MTSDADWTGDILGVNSEQLLLGREIVAAMMPRQFPHPR